MFWSRPSLPEKLNICLVTKKSPTVGFLWAIAQRLARRGNKVTILTWKKPSGKFEVNTDLLSVYFLGDDGLGSLEQFPEAVLRKFEQLHDREPFDLVHSLDESGHLIGESKRSLRVATAYNVAAIHLERLFSILGMSQETLGSLIKTSLRVSYHFLRAYYGFDRRLLKNADAMFVHSSQQKTALERYYLYPDLRIHMVPFGLELEDLSPKEKSQELMKKIGFPANAQVVTTVTDMTDLGEMRNLLRAFEQLAVKKPLARLIVVGSGPLKKQIEYEMLCLALGSRVLFLGDIPSHQLGDYIALSDVFVNLSARFSALDQSLLEAMAQKKIIVGSEFSPLASLIEDGKEGFLIRPADTVTLRELFLQIFNDQLPATEIGERAREKVLNLFDAEKMVEQTLVAYRKAIARAGYFRALSRPIPASVTARSH